MASGIRRGSLVVPSLGWIVALSIAAILIVHGLFWYSSGPGIMLENIAERARMSSSVFRQGEPSSYDIVALIARNYAILELALGALALSVGWQGFRHGNSWARTAMLLPFAAIAGMAVNFMLSGGVEAGASYLLAALVGLGGLFAAGRREAREQAERE